MRPDDELAALQARLAEAQDTLRAIRAGEVDALIVDRGNGEELYTLRSAEQPYRHLVEIMQEGAVMLTRDRDILYCNRQFAAMAGISLDRAVGGSIDRFFDDAGRAALRRLMLAHHGKEPARLQSLDGRTIDVLLSLMTDDHDEVRHANLIVTDLTELSDARAGRHRAERENQAKDEFIAMLAHELRNPLNAITGAAQVIDMAGVIQGPASRAQGVILRQARHLSRLVDDLFETGRAMTGKIRLEPRLLDLSDVVSRALEVFEHRKDGPRLEIAADHVPVHVDPVRLEQVVVNLVSNAMKFTPASGTVRVTVSAECGEAVLRVEDTGIGMGADLLPRVFEPFVQGEHSLDRPGGGLGIGLTLVRQLIELHRGTVTAESAGPGCGSSFIVRLPRPLGATVGDEAALTVDVAPPRRVLIVEDNDDARETFRLMLELAGHDVIEARDGVRGLELLTASPPDVAIIDIGLPKLDGYEVARRFRAERPDNRVLLIAVTGYGMPHAREKSRVAGFDQHLIKPVTLEMLQMVFEQAS